ncbi:MAG: histidine kinase, partial [gamma proteobacterium symbiont of Stewartia floridana]
MDKPPEKVLMVDDDRNLLDSFRRQFRKRLNLETATSGADGVQAVRDGGPFALVVSDMQMPNMNGVEFLSKVRELSPNTVRIMLTGNA